MIIYAPDAEHDIERLHAWYLERSGVAASAFMARLALAERRIEARPKLYRTLRDRKTRRYSFKINRTTIWSTPRLNRRRSWCCEFGMAAKTAQNSPAASICVRRRLPKPPHKAAPCR